MNAPNSAAGSVKALDDASPRCATCGTAYPDGSRFCHEDGSQLSLSVRRVHVLSVRDPVPLSLDATLRVSTSPADPLAADPASTCAVEQPRSEGATSRANVWLIAGRYLKLRTLGDGAQGAVLLVQDIQSGRVLALKQFRPEVETARCREEIEAAARIEDHTHIVKIYELHRDPETRAQYLTMEYLEGETLSARLERGTLPLLEAVSVLHQASCGLSEMHDKLLVHRDVKPSNIMLVPSATGVRVKLLDLGITKSLTPGAKSLTQPGWVVGSLDYAAPEQLRGEPVTPSFDIYALGVLAHVLLTGHLPNEPEAVFARAAPPELCRLIASMLDPEPSRRPRCMRDITRALEGIELLLGFSAHGKARAEIGAPAQGKLAIWGAARTKARVPADSPRSNACDSGRKTTEQGVVVPWVVPKRSALPRLGVALLITLAMSILFTPVLKSADEYLLTQPGIDNAAVEGEHAAEAVAVELQSFAERHSAALRSN